MTIRLYEISEEYLHALDALEHDDIPQDAIADTLEGLSAEWQDKAVNVARYIKNLEAEANAIKQAMDAMDMRYRKLVLKISSLKSYLTCEIEKTGLEAKAPDIGRVRVINNRSSVYVTDPELIPDEFCEDRTERVIRKALISNAIKDGKEVPGAELVQAKRLVIG